VAAWRSGTRGWKGDEQEDEDEEREKGSRCSPAARGSG